MKHVTVKQQIKQLVISPIINNSFTCILLLLTEITFIWQNITGIVWFDKTDDGEGTVYSNTLCGICESVINFIQIPSMHQTLEK